MCNRVNFVNTTGTVQQDLDERPEQHPGGTPTTIFENPKQMLKARGTRDEADRTSTNGSEEPEAPRVSSPLVAPLFLFPCFEEDYNSLTAALSVTALYGKGFGGNSVAPLYPPIVTLVVLY